MCGGSWFGGIPFGGIPFGDLNEGPGTGETSITHTRLIPDGWRFRIPYDLEETLPEPG